MSEETQETRPVNGKSMYSYIADAWDVPEKSYVKALNYERRIQWRKEDNFVRVDKPTRLDRARALGYKAKQGYVIVRARVRKGSFRKRAIVTGRRAKRKGINQIITGKSIQRMAAIEFPTHSKITFMPLGSQVYIETHSPIEWDRWLIPD